MGKLQFTTKIIKKVSENLPAILSTLAGAGLLCSVFSAAKKGPKAAKALEQAKADKVAGDANSAALDIYRDEDGVIDLTKVKLNPWELIKTLGPIYWDTALMTGGTLYLIFKAHKVNAERLALAGTIIKLNEKQLREGKAKAEEILGKEKVKQVEDEIDKDKAANCPEELEKQYKPGLVYPCMFVMGDAWFLSERSKIEKAFTEWNNEAVEEARAALDRDVELDLESLIYKLGIENQMTCFEDTEIYKHKAWNLKNGLVYPIFKQHPSSGDVPVIIVRFSREPDTNYKWK